MKKTQRRSTKTYIFHRGNVWYPIDLYDDADAVANALHNKGTTKVTTPSGKVVWELPNNLNSQTK